jgi:hypothetical protein
MGKLTEEKIASIIKTFGRTKSYKETAEIEHTNWKTVKKHIVASKQKSAEGSEAVRSIVPANGGNRGLVEGEKESTSPPTSEYSIYDRFLSSRGSLAAAAFAQFRHGKGPVDVVISLRIPPEEVESLYEEFVKLEGGVHLPKEAKDNLDAFMTKFNIHSLRKLTGRIMAEEKKIKSKKK